MNSQKRSTSEGYDSDTVSFTRTIIACFINEQFKFRHHLSAGLNADAATLYSLPDKPNAGTVISKPYPPSHPPYPRAILSAKMNCGCCFLNRVIGSFYKLGF